MKTLVAIAKSSGQLMCLTPLVPIEMEKVIDDLSGYSVAISRVEPLAYAVDTGEFCQLMNAKILEKYVEILGDL